MQGDQINEQGRSRRRSSATSFSATPSSGGVIGIGIGVASALVAVAVLIGARGAQPPMVLLGIGIALVAVGVGVVAIAGAIQCVTIRYVVGPIALEIQTALGRASVPYDLIDSIQGGIADNAATPNPLWPGAAFGYADTPNGGATTARGTSTDSRKVVTVAAGPRVYLLTPSDPTGFKDALIERARSATPRPHVAPTTGASWLDRVAERDLWFRLMGVAAVGVAALDFVLSTSRGGGAWSHHTFAAVAALVVNLALGSTVLAGVQAAPRLLLGTTMCGQVLAMLW